MVYSFTGRHVATIFLFNIKRLAILYAYFPRNSMDIAYIYLAIWMLVVTIFGHRHIFPIHICQIYSVNWLLPVELAVN